MLEEDSLWFTTVCPKNKREKRSDPKTSRAEDFPVLAARLLDGPVLRRGRR